MNPNEQTTEQKKPGIVEGIRNALNKLSNGKMGNNTPIADNGSKTAFGAIEQPIGREAVLKASQILNTYHNGKANLEKKIVENEQWFKVRHWGVIGKNKAEMLEPSSAWLFNAIAGKHADAMDNFPSPNVLPREEGDKAEAEMLSSILPVILDNTDFEAVYDDVWNYKLKTGTGVYSITWDSTKLNGLGDISIQKADLLNLFWESGITDIQQSPNLFNVKIVDNEALERAYPQLKNKLGGKTISVREYIYDDTVDTTKKSCVVDWYYKKANSQGKQVLHYVKYVNDIVLYATENNPETKETGLYDHGMYPFIFDVCFRIEGSPAGFGYIDIGKSAQEFIDRGNQAFMANLLSNAAPRYFIRNDGSVKEEEYADMTNTFIHVDGNLGQDSIMAVQGKPLNDIYVQVINNKIEELKETTGNRDVSNGGTSGVTAASAIAAQQEAAARLSRNDIKASYRTFRKIVLMCIELIRQFYDLPRCFRIMGQNGEQKYVYYTNAGLTPQSQGTDFGIDGGFRVPLFDIEVTAQKASPYSKMAQNELALQFYQLGFFNPNVTDQALACLDMMDFDRKSFVVDKLQQNGTMMQTMMMLAQMVDAQNGTGNAMQTTIAERFGMPMPQRNPSGETAEKNTVLGGEGKETTKHMERAKKQTAESTSPV